MESVWSIAQLTPRFVTACIYISWLNLICFQRTTSHAGPSDLRARDRAAHFRIGLDPIGATEFCLEARSDHTHDSKTLVSTAGESSSTHHEPQFYRKRIVVVV